MARSEGNSSELEDAEIAKKAAEVDEHSLELKGDEEADEATQAASEDLKHASIQDKEAGERMEVTEGERDGVAAERKQKLKTPEREERETDKDAEMREMVSSPKKKRGREQDDDVKETEKLEGGLEEEGTTNGRRSGGAEPEKKRHRDTSTDPAAETEVVDVEAKSAPETKPLLAEKKDGVTKPDSAVDLTKSSETGGTDAAAKEEPKKIFGQSASQTSSAAFSNSGFAAAAAAGSSFGNSTGKPSVFGGGKPMGGFGSTLSGATKPLSPELSASSSVFGGGDGTKSAFGGSTFGGSSSTFGSATGGFASSKGGFGSSGSGFGGTGFSSVFATGGQKLSTFAGPAKDSGEATEKPAKAFGAPDSDAEEDSEDGEDSEGDEESETEEKGGPSEEKKKSKISKVIVESGEEDEATLIQFQAKIYAMREKAWKETGSGILKLNVPKDSVDYDLDYVPILGSFDPSGRDDSDEETKSSSYIPRLILRQNNTHRLVLNTPISKGTQFKAIPDRNDRVKITFLGFDGGQPVPMLIATKEENSKILLAEIESIQKEFDRVPVDGSSSPSVWYVGDGSETALILEIRSTKLPIMQAASSAGAHRTGVKRKRQVVSNTDAVEANGFSTIANESSVSTSIPTKTQDGGHKPRRTTKSKAPPKLTRNSSSTTVPSTIPWPPYFTSLSRTHKALNLVFTFCSTRKHLATTFDTIKTAVQSHTSSELEIEDVAAIVALRPGGINFAYVDEAMLLVDVRGSERDDTFKGGRAKNFHSAGPAPDASVGGITGLEELGQDAPVPGKEVLYFEFVDGDLKRQVVDKKTGEVVRPSQKLRNEDLKMPVFSQKQMMGLIEKRNVKFKNAVDTFLNKCDEEGVYAERKLRKEAEAFIPVPTDSRAGSPKPDFSVLPQSIPKERASISTIINELKESEWYSGQIVPDGHRVFDPQEAIYGDLNFRLSQDLVNALYNTKNITQLYSHQAEAINNLHDGHHVIVATSTSSGKSLIYQIPVLHELEQDHNTRAMYIFPTKALAQDQRRSLKEMMRFMTGLEETVVETFDGDTPNIDRNLIREEGRIIFTNPDMLHITILPQEDRWRTFLQNLKYVVVDEIHVYNGLFGSHVAFIMRRLQRICAALGNRHIKFISCSATVANPEEHFKTIFGIEDVKMTDFDGSPSGRKEFLCWNTPYKDPGDPASGRGDTKYETARLFCQLILRGVRVIAFCVIRKGCEALVAAVKQELTNLGRADVMARVMGYRGGYTPQDRRRIESEMFEGKLMGIVATTALELGVDIGSLDAVITMGFPYTIANLRQQSGRAGRRNKDSMSVLIGDCFPTDQFYMQNPDEIFTKPNCELQVDLQNMLVFEGHVQCAAYEMPIRPDEDASYFGKLLSEVVEERMVKDDLGFYHCSERYRPHPSKFVSIRDTEEDHFAIVDISHGKNIVLEELEASRAFFTLYDGGIFLHQGNTYLVKEFLPDRKIAKVELVKVDWTTEQRDFTDIDPIETEAIRRLPKSLSKAFYGTIKIQQNVFGYFKIDRKRRILDAVEVDNPPIILFSKGLWLDVPKKALDILVDRKLHVAAGIHAAEHAVMSLMPNFVISMPGDVRTECKVPQKEYSQKESSRKRPARLTFYDAKGGASGSGISTKAFEFIDLLLKQAVRRVEACCCDDGCLECVAAANCKHQNEVMSKAGAGVILRSLLNWSIDIDALPMGPEEGPPFGETVVLAEEVRGRGRLVEVFIKREEGPVEVIIIEGEKEKEFRVKEEPID